MYRLGRSVARGGNGIYLHLHKNQPQVTKAQQQVSLQLHFSARTFCVSVNRPAGTGSKELDELILGSNVGEGAVPVNPLPISPTSETSPDSAVPLADPSTLPLPESISNIASSTSEYVSPFLSVDKVEYSNLVEPSLQSLGLAHGWPSGYLQSFLELLHIEAGLPWWQAIVATTVCLRIVVLPIMVTAQKNMARMNNHQPTLQKLQIEAQLAGMRDNKDQTKFAHAALDAYQNKHNLHPIKNLLPMWVNGLFMTSMFFGLRGMTNVPVESMTTGGTAWFTDLVASDPTFILPLTASGTIALMMYLGADGMNLDTIPPIMKKVMLAIPIVSIPVMIAFPAALGVYWVTNNFISLCQSRILRIPAVRQSCGIPEIIKWKPEELPMTTFMEQLKAAHIEQEKKKKRESAAREANKMKLQEHENKVRGALLDAFTKEDQERLQKNARKRLGGKE